MENQSLTSLAYRVAGMKMASIIDKFNQDKMRLYRKECVCLYAADIQYDGALVGSVRLWKGKKGIEHEVTTVSG